MREALSLWTVEDIVRYSWPMDSIRLAHLTREPRSVAATRLYLAWAAGKIAKTVQGVFIPLAKAGRFRGTGFPVAKAL